MIKLTRRELITSLVATMITPSIAFAKENQRLVMPDRVFTGLVEEGIRVNSLSFSKVSASDCSTDHTAYKLVFLKDDYSAKKIFEHRTRGEAIKELQYQGYGAATLQNYDDGYSIAGIYSVFDGNVLAASPLYKDGSFIPSIRASMNQCMA